MSAVQYLHELYAGCVMIMIGGPGTAELHLTRNSSAARHTGLMNVTF